MGSDSDGGGTKVNGRWRSQQAYGPSRQWVKLALLGVVFLVHITPTGAQGTLGGPIDDLLLWYKLDDGTGSSAVVGLLPLRPGSLLLLSWSRLHRPLPLRVQDSSGNGFTGTLYTGDGYYSTWYGVKCFDAYTSGGDTGIKLPTSFITSFLGAANYTIMLHFNGAVGDA